VKLSSRLPRSWSSWLLLVAAISVATSASLYARRYHFNVVDDAYISFQYAKNWALGQGLVFNPGERVEGYTNFLWVVLLTPLYALSRALSFDFTTVAIGVNIALAIVNLGLVHRVGLRLFRGDQLATSLAVLLCALDDSYRGYAMSAMENHLVMALGLSALLVWLTQPRGAAWWLGALFALVTMARPDGILLVVAFGLGVGPTRVLGPDELGRAPRSRRDMLLALAALLGTFLLLYGSYFAWRAIYYGSALPNTFYLKVGRTFGAWSRGLDYTRHFFEGRYYLPALAALAIGLVHLPAVRWLLLYLVAHTAYVTYVGGDFYEGHRFYVVLLPFYYLLLGACAAWARRAVSSSEGWRRIRGRPAVIVPLVALGCGLGAGALWAFAVRSYSRGIYLNEVVRWGATVDNNVRYMKWLGTVARPGGSIVLGDIGAAGFFASLRVLDTYGVVDPAVAHQEVESFGRGKPGHEKRASDQSLLDRAPTFIKWGYIRGDLHAQGYFVFTDFPAELNVPGLWIRENRERRWLLPRPALHFETPDLRGWEVTGDAFRSMPTRGTPIGQSPVHGQTGAYINSFSPRLGDRATGRVVSPPFELVGRLLLLRVGGGRDLARLRVSLLIDGRSVYTATGHNQEVLGRREWNLVPYAGKEARLEIVDDSTEPWGHILVDEVVQWSGPGP
jgi:hypothetical protein